MDLFSTEKRQAVYQYLETNKGIAIINQYLEGLTHGLKKIKSSDTHDVGQIMILMDKVILTCKLSKSFDYQIIDKPTCKTLLSLIRDIMRFKALKVALYVFKGDRDISENVQRALFFTLTGEDLTIHNADAYYKFLDEPLYMTITL